jgi:manganese/zinc/iron transport system substrate-binding protein
VAKFLIDEVDDWFYRVFMSKQNVIKIILFSLIALLSNCSEQKSSGVWKSDDKVKVAATTTMVQDLVKVIGGDEVEIYGLMAEGMDPHSYSERSTDMTALKSADLVFYNGLHLEEKLQENLEKLKHSHAVTSGMEKMDIIIPEEKYSEYADPHVWGDPLLWAEAVPVVVEALVEKDPENAKKYKERGLMYMTELTLLEIWAKKRLSEIPAGRRVLITSHDAFMYYARAFNFEVRAIDGLAPGDKGGPKKVAELIEFIKERKVKMIFPESEANSKGIESIAQEAGVAVSKHELFADATGKQGEMETVNGETYDLGSYLGMMKHNINAIVEGLK